MVRTLVKKGTAWLLLGLLFCQTMIFGVSAQQTARHPFYHVVLFASLKGEENPTQRSTVAIGANKGAIDSRFFCRFFPPFPYILYAHGVGGACGTNPCIPPI